MSIASLDCERLDSSILLHPIGHSNLMLLDQVVGHRLLPGPHRLRRFLGKTLPNFKIRLQLLQKTADNLGEPIGCTFQ